jgi:NAD(P)H-flavin reductase/ferredoxin
MTFTVSVDGSDVSFVSEEGETLLDAAERAGFSIPYSCRKGVCSTCEGTLCSGSVQVKAKSVTGPADAVLFCQSKATSDLVIKPKRIERYDRSARKKIAAKVFRLTRPADDVVVLQLRFPASVRAKFKAGQYLQVAMPGGDTRNFSMANPPHESDGVQLHIRHVPGGAFSETVLANLAQGDTLDVEVPFGDFHVREEGEGGFIFLATGTGFAPLKSMIEDLIKRGSSRPVRLYWGGRRRQDLYLSDLADKWARRAPWFTFVPVLSEPDDEWTGRRGLVHRAVMEDLADLSDWHVYACGNPMMITVAQREFSASRGLQDDRFYADPFVPSGGQPACA